MAVILTGHRQIGGKISFGKLMLSGMLAQIYFPHIRSRRAKQHRKIAGSAAQSNRSVSVMHRSLLILALLFGLLTACNNRKAQQLAFGAREMQLIDGYYSADVSTAEKSLLQMSEHLREGQRLKIEKRDYDYTLGLVHGRLALLYQQVGRSSDDAEAEFRKALAHWSRHSGAEGQKRQDLVKLINTLDQNREVKWKTKP